MVAPIPDMLALQSLTPEDLAARLGLPLDDARRIVAAVHREVFVFRAFAGVRRASVERVAAAAVLPELSLCDVAASQRDPFVKLALSGQDGGVFETVRIPLEKPGRFSACVSSQVGCALACAFCATGRLGLLRNLETWEIVEQVRAVRRTLGPKQRVHGVVFQGMGEPLANLDRVLAAIAVFTEPAAQAIDGRNVTICTSGLTPGIGRLAREAPRVRLGLSIGSARSEVRAALMPVERRHSLDEVLEAAAEHSLITGLAPMWAVTLLLGVNDSDEDAHALAERAIGFLAKTGRKPRISILAYNPSGDALDRFTRVCDEREQAFRAVLHARGLPSHRRYSGGSDVGAACGQLAARAGRETRRR